MTTKPINTKLFEARDYQERINGKLSKNWNDGFVSQLLVSPTGSGKTAMGLQAARDFVNVVAPALFGVKSEEVGVAWVAMRRNLLTQANEENHALYKEDAKEDQLCPNIHFVSMFAKEVDCMKKYKIRLVVSDEAHHDCVDSMLNIHNMVKPDAVIGLSATPARQDRISISFQRTVRDAGYRFLINEGYLSGFNQWYISEYTPESIAEAYIRDADKWGKSLAFFLNTSQCEECAAPIRAAGHTVEIVTGKSDKEQQLQDFEDGKVDFLISMAVLTEGFDCPSLNTVFVRDTGHESPMTQMAGRVLRLFNGVVKNIVQTSICKHPFIKIADPVSVHHFNKGEWVRVDRNEKLEELSQRMTKVGRELAIERLKAIAEEQRATAGERIADAMQNAENFSTDARLEEQMDQGNFDHYIARDLD